MRSILPRRADARRRSPRRALLSAGLALALTAPVALASTTAAAAPTGDPDRAAAGYLIDSLEAADQVGANRLSDTILALAAAGSGGDAAETFGDRLEAVIADSFADLNEVTAAGVAAKAVLALDALDRDADDVGGVDLVGALVDLVDDTGAVADGQLFTQSLAILALSTTDTAVPATAVDFLEGSVCDDGGYVFNPAAAPDCAGDPDTTAVAGQALDAADRDVTAQVTFLLDAQDDATGAFRGDGQQLSSNSSALAAQFLRAAGGDDGIAAANEAAAFVATLFEGCDAAEDVRGSYRQSVSAGGDRFIATSQAVFASAQPLDLLTLDGATTETERLNCSDAFCPPDAGISVAVDFTTLAPDANVEVRCATDLPEDPSGLDVLEAAGFEIETEKFSFGTALCSIDGMPELQEGDCLSPVSDGFYGYFNAPLGGDWSASEVGAGDSSPQVGTIEGFAWAPNFVGGPPRVSTTPALAPEPEPQPEPQPEPPFDRGLANACPDDYPRTFTDVPADSTHALAIACLGSTPIVQGTGDGTTFSPSIDVSRDQIASLLVRSIERATGETLPVGDADFDDIAGNFHADAIRKLANAGVVRGTGDGSSFSPRASLDRQQMASLLDRALDFLDDEQVNGSFPAPAAVEGVFSDVNPASVHAPAIDRLANQGVVAGRADGTFGPTVSVRRDQVVSFVARSLDLAVTEGLAPPVEGD